MRIHEALGRDILIWGTGKEGRAAAHWLARLGHKAVVTFLDEAQGPDQLADVGLTHHVARGSESIRAEIQRENAVLLKSPGVSLYHPLIEEARRNGVAVTSLLNLWMQEPCAGRRILVTGTKGKSTTCALLAHALRGLGRSTVLAGNIGIPVTQAQGEAEFYVVEVSSYQAADFNGLADMALVTCLYPEHLDWHGDLATYYRDKLNVLGHARAALITPQARQAALDAGIEIPPCAEVLNVDMAAAEVPGHAYLARPHNRANVAAVLAVVARLGLDADAARRVLADFAPLPHRQQELGMKDGVLYVDDSIATTPQSAIAALQAYADRPVTLIAGGFDRGLDYAPLIDQMIRQGLKAVILMGPSGLRMTKTLCETPDAPIVHEAKDMAQALDLARRVTPPGGVVLLSPAAPSYGLFKDFEHRGACFAQEAGF